ncbi:hypothetical protein CVV38_02715 [Candidatus Peregrinibacteria bacterium HGW-Peregrinibacteria-1]|jgi:hypothetical protein|nr:MAG: hypothetical protein CVV38_02715 [Candidatus Peregrinibacteria bacterium HGW-Peregrinibacteria-1]
MTPEPTPNTPQEQLSPPGTDEVITPNPEIQANPEKFADAAQEELDKEKSPEKKRARERVRELAKKTKDKVDTTLKVSSGMKAAMGVGGVILGAILISKMFSSKKETESSNNSTLKTILGIGALGAGLYALDKYTGLPFGKKYSRYIDNLLKGDDKEKKAKEKAEKKEAEKPKGPPEGYITYGAGINETLESTAPELQKSIRSNREGLGLAAWFTGAFGGLVDAVKGTGKMGGGAFLSLAQGTVDTVTGHPIASVFAGAAIVSNMDKIKFPEDSEFRYMPKDPTKRADHFKRMFKTEEVQAWLDEQDLHLDHAQIDKISGIIGNPDELKKFLNEHVKVDKLADMTVEAIALSNRKTLNSHNIEFLTRLRIDLNNQFAQNHQAEELKTQYKNAIKNAQYRLRQNSIEKSMTEEQLNQHRKEILEQLLANLKSIEILDIQLGEDNIYRYAIRNEEGFFGWDQYTPLFVDPSLSLADQSEKANDAMLESAGYLAAFGDNGFIEGIRERLGSVKERVDQGESVITIVGGEALEMKLDTLETLYIGPFKIVGNLVAGAWNGATGEDGTLEVATAFQEYGKGIAAMAMFGTSVGIAKAVTSLVTKGPKTTYLNIKNRGLLAPGKAILGWAAWPYKGAVKIKDLLYPPIREMVHMGGPIKGISEHAGNLNKLYRGRMSVHLEELKNSAIARFLRNPLSGKNYRGRIGDARRALVERQKVYNELLEHRIKHGLSPTAVPLSDIDRTRLIKGLHERGQMTMAAAEAILKPRGASRIDIIINKFESQALIPQQEHVKKFHAFLELEHIRNEVAVAQESKGPARAEKIKYVNEKLKKIGITDFELNDSNFDATQKRLSSIIDNPEEFKKVTGIDHPSQASPETPSRPPLDAEARLRDTRTALKASHEAAVRGDLTPEQYRQALKEAQSNLRSAGIEVDLGKIDDIKTPQDVATHATQRSTQVNGIIEALGTPEGTARMQADTIKAGSAKPAPTPADVPGAKRVGGDIEAGRQHPGATPDKPTGSPDAPHRRPKAPGRLGR